MDRKPVPRDASEAFRDPFLIDDESLLDRLDIDQDSQLSVGDMLNQFQPRSTVRALSEISEIPHHEIRSDYQPGVFKAVRRYVQSKLEDSWNN